MGKKNPGEIFIESARFRFLTLKVMGTRSFEQLGDDDLRWKANEETNSIAVIVQHLHGNMLSRWTDFLTSDGEKPTRQRDAEFTEPEAADKAALIEQWEEGWACVLEAVKALTAEDLAREVPIRGQALTVIDAVNRQLVHYGYHTGQIVHIAKSRKGKAWKTLSVPRGESGDYVPAGRD